MPRITDRTIAFATPWFDVVAKQVDGDRSPHYTVQPPDYVTVLASDLDGRILMVKQYRPVVETFTLELPSGMVDAGETPDACVRRELVEETGHAAGDIELLGTLVPDVGRLGNRMWCYAASGVRPMSPAPPIEDGIELLRMTPDELIHALATQQVTHALNFAAILLAVLKERFSLRSEAPGR
jgi:ADP-ribose pyrophosphatase